MPEAEDEHVPKTHGERMNEAEHEHDEPNHGDRMNEPGHEHEPNIQGDRMTHDDESPADTRHGRAEGDGLFAPLETETKEDQ